MWHDSLTMFHDDWYRCSSGIKGLLQKLHRLNVGITGGNIYRSF
jgi:hypothetical protein